MHSEKVDFSMGFSLHRYFGLHDFMNPDARLSILQPLNPEMVNKV
jgi:hypothetical protein